MEKAMQIFLRYGFSDAIVSKDNDNDENYKITSDDTYFIGYEDEHGRECEEDGTYL